MDFFRSVFSDESDPVSKPRSPSPSIPDSPTDVDLNEENPNPSATAAWSFGGLIKNLATRSESVIETYRRDLEEFRSGLKKESEVLRDVASRAVRDLPVSLEVGASAAQESLESVGQAIDEFGSSVWRGTAEIISQGKDVIFDADSDSSNQNSASALNSKPYSRFEAQLVGIQSDPATYSEEPEDLEDFKKWEAEFHLDEKLDDIEILCEENDTLAEIYAKLVPSVVDHSTFWCRYFYRIYKLKLAEDARANLVKRAIFREDDEELSWEVEDSDEGEIAHNLESRDLVENVAKVEEKNLVSTEENPVEGNFISYSDNPKEADGDGPGSVKEFVFAKNCDEKLKCIEKETVVESSSDESVEKSDALEGKIEVSESSKDSDLSIVSSQQSAHEEEDLGWDEIEDLSSIDDKKGAKEPSANKEYLRKRLIATDEDEDLSWDIEDDEASKH